VPQLSAFADRVARLARKADLAEVAKQSLEEIMGESAASAVTHHLGGAEVLRDPVALERSLKNLLGIGAEIVFRIHPEELGNTSNIEARDGGREGQR